MARRFSAAHINMPSPTSYKLQATSYQGGQAIIAAVIFLVLLSTVILGGLVMPIVRSTKAARGLQYSKTSFYGAESGIEDAVYRLRNNLITSPTTYILDVGGDAVIVDVASAGNSRTVTTTGNHQNRYRKIEAQLDTSDNGASLFYGIQVGDGGLQMNQNSHVIGNVYSDGSIAAENGSTISGDVIVAGGINADPSLEYAADNADYNFPASVSTRDAAQSFTAPATGKLNRVAIKIGKFGTPANLTLRLTVDNGDKPDRSDLASALIPASSVGLSVGWVNVSFASPPTLTNGTKYWIVLDGAAPAGNNYASNYWIWRKDTTDAYANNTGKSTSDWPLVSATWAALSSDLSFRVWVGGTTNSIDRATIGDASSGTAWANVFTNTTVHGSSCPNPYCIVDTPAHIELPISDGLIQDWRDQGSAGGTYAGTYNINGSANLGPKKIVGDLSVNLGTDDILTIKGTIWVTGNISFSCVPSSLIKLDSAYGASSGVIVADGTITVLNNCSFSNSGTAGSYILLLSAKNDPAGTAISVLNNSNGVIYYAGTSRISFANNATAREATAYGITLNQNVIITYESGLADVNFSSGPAGTFVITSWREIQ